MRRTLTTIATAVGFFGCTVAALAAPAEHEAAGEAKPELIGFDPVTAVWVVVIFVLLLAVLYPTAWRAILAGLKAREERIRKDIADAEAARDALIAKGVAASDVDDQPWGRFVYFSDPDGNAWALQQLPPRS